MNPDITTTEADMIEQGHVHMTGTELERRIVGKTVLGDFGQHFKFVSTIEHDGTMEGKNNFGTHDVGRWSIDKTNNTFSVEWDGGWVSATSHAYDVDGTIKFYAVGTGVWGSTFTSFVDNIPHPLEWPS